MLNLDWERNPSPMTRQLFLTPNVGAPQLRPCRLFILSD
jgi:hypothetical protein